MVVQWRGAPAGMLLLGCITVSSLLALHILYTGAAGQHTIRLSATTVRHSGTACNGTQVLAAVSLQSQQIEQIVQHMTAFNESIQRIIETKDVRVIGRLVDKHTNQGLRESPDVATKAPQVPAAAVHHVGKAKAACDAKSMLNMPSTTMLIAPVVIVAHDRLHYLAKCLMTTLRYWSEDNTNVEKFPIFVSVDGGHPATTFFASALQHAASIQVIHNTRDLERCKPGDGYCNLSLHYQMLLQLFFSCNKAPRLLFLEDDLEIAPDFFSYFSALAPLLDKDPTLWCISAWNDLGQQGRASNTTALLRTDILPGLGWMLSANVGNELWPQWPNMYWDDWLREPGIRKGRQCVFPEVSRTHTFGRSGTSGGILFDQHLKTMVLNAERIDWSKQDVSHMVNSSYVELVAQSLAEAEAIDRANIKDYCAVDAPPATNPLDLVIYYSSLQDYQAIAKLLPPMLNDVKGGQPRSSYHGMAVVRCRGRRLFLAPAKSFLKL